MWPRVVQRCQEFRPSGVKVDGRHSGARSSLTRWDECSHLTDEETEVGRPSGVPHGRRQSGF